MANLHVPIYRPDLSDTINRLANRRVCMATRCARDSNPTRRPVARKARHFVRTRYFCSAVFLVSMRNTMYYRRNCVTWLFMLPVLAAMAVKLQQTTEIIFSISSVLLLAAASKLPKKRKRKKRSVWVRNWLLQRDSNGAYNQIIEELRTHDPSSYKSYVRMDAKTFEVSP